MKKRMFVSAILVPIMLAIAPFAFGQNPVIWEIGQPDGSPAGMALAPGGYADFVGHDFGYEDRFFLVGHSSSETDWPYVLPGPANGWGGTGRTAGIRSHVLQAGFVMEAMPQQAPCRLVVAILDTEHQAPPLLKITVNNQSWTYQLTGGSGSDEPKGPFQPGHAQQVVVDLPAGSIREGYNAVAMTTLFGGWLVFDNIRLEGPSGAIVATPGDALIKNVAAAAYEVTDNGKRYQPLLIDVAHLENRPTLMVQIDGDDAFSATIERGEYQFEVPMPRVTRRTTSQYAVYLDGALVSEGKIERAPHALATPADYVNTMMGAGHSRWMIAPGPWMPFSMVKISPDNQNSGWQSGYDPTFESIGTFSHIHEWTMAGLGTFPVTGQLVTQIGDESDPDSGYRSRIDKGGEEAPLGYYKVQLTDYDITAELTATTRASMQRYTYHSADTGRVMVDFTIPAEYGYQVEKLEVKQVSPYRLEGSSTQFSRGVWSKDADQAYVVHFVMEFDRPIIRTGTWLNGNVEVAGELHATDVEKAGMFVEFDTKRTSTLQVRTGISYVSKANAAANLETEISTPFGWGFDAVRDHQRNVWNDLLARVAVLSNDRREKIRFYTNMYRSLASRNIFSDVDGKWRDADERIQQFSNADDVALGCDAFWNTFWNLNQFWNLVTPEWSNRWVRSQLAMFDANGWLAKGPAGMEYIPVMVAEHEIPLIVGAYQMGIRDFDAQKAFEAVYKMQTTPAERVAGGLAGNRDLVTYLKHQYVPYDEGRFSNTLEYSYDDWTVSQFAKSLGKHAEYQQFKERGQWWRNAIDPTTGYARMKDAAGNWFADFDPFKSGANKHYVEGNAWQLTYFVPQDVTGLAALIGQDTFINRLQWGFEESYKWRFNGPNDQYWDYPVVQGNQQSMHFAYLFNWVGRPWLTQHWSRAIMDRYYGYGVSNAYLGDEDQGQMSAWFVMSALGLFQTDGGARQQPIYEIGSPIFERVDIDLGERFGRSGQLTIIAKNTSRENRYVQQAWLNGEPLENSWFLASEVLHGGTLELVMGPEPNTEWGTAVLPPVSN